VWGESVAMMCIGLLSHRHTQPCQFIRSTTKIHQDAFLYLKKRSTHFLDQRLIRPKLFLLAPFQSAPLFPASTSQSTQRRVGSGHKVDRYIFAPFKAHSSGWAVLGTLAFPFCPGWGTPLWSNILGTSPFILRISCFEFFSHKLMIWIRPAPSSHPEVGR